MNQIVRIYNEGIDTKVAVISRLKNKVKIEKIFTVSALTGSQHAVKESFSLSLDGLDSDFSLDSSSAVGMDNNQSNSDIAEIASKLKNINLTKYDFLPVISEPTINYHIFEGSKEKDSKKLLQSVIKEIRESKGINLTIDRIGYIENSENKLQLGFVEDGIPAVDQIAALAELNKRRYFRITSIKSAELSLYYYVTKNNKFYPEDYSLVIYAGKDSSKLLFLEGNKLKHIGSALDIGTQNLYTYDVYFSKILLEMENGGIPRLDNVVLCGEDNSENLILSFYGTFPEANVIKLKFDNFDTTSLSEEEISSLGNYSLPLAATFEYFDEIDKKYSGFNILPFYVKENQKLFQFGWHSYIILPLLFLATYYFTVNILEKSNQLSIMDKEIERLTQLQIKNQTILDQMTGFSVKINNFDATQSILDSASLGTGAWGHNFEKISNFIEKKQSFWISKLATKENVIELNGYALSRKALTEYAEMNKTSLLQNMLFEPLREVRAYAFVLKYNIDDK